MNPIEEDKESMPLPEPVTADTCNEQTLTIDTDNIVVNTDRTEIVHY